MTSGGRAMKILKIDNNKGYFRTSDTEKWMAIDEIDKDKLMELLNLFLEKEVEMDSLDEKTLSNQAHSIIYKSIHDKFKTLENNKSKFKDEAGRTYLSAMQKYSDT